MAGDKIILIVTKGSKAANSTSAGAGALFLLGQVIKLGYYAFLLYALAACLAAFFFPIFVAYSTIHFFIPSVPITGDFIIRSGYDLLYAWVMTPVISGYGVLMLKTYGEVVLEDVEATSKAESLGTLLGVTGYVFLVAVYLSSLFAVVAGRIVNPLSTILFSNLIVTSLCLFISEPCLRYGLRFSPVAKLDEILGDTGIIKYGLLWIAITYPGLYVAHIFTSFSVPVIGRHETEYILFCLIGAVLVGVAGAVLSQLSHTESQYDSPRV